MSDIVIQVDSLSKRYRLGIVGSRTLHHDFERWWARVRGKPDPYLKIGETKKTESRKQKADNGGKAEKAKTESRNGATVGNSFQLSTFQLSALNSLSALPPADDPDHIWALRDVSFEVKQGEVLGIIGRNGAGKSTLLKILSRVTAPTLGEVRVKGRIASLLEVGTGFHPELTGRENIFLNGAILGMTKAEIRRKFDEIVAFSEVEKFIDTPVKRYSSGMYVRLAFAVAAHLDPEILIIDEVLAVGDVSFQKKCLGKMHDVAAGGRTVLFVSHNMAAVSQLCENAILLADGQLRLRGEPGAVIQVYLSQSFHLSAEQSWDYPGNAPGDERIRLLGLSLRQKEHITAVVDINEEFVVQIRFLVLKNARNLNSGLNFLTSQGTCVFASVDWRDNFLEPGVYQQTLHVPGPFLAEGAYSILTHLTFYDPYVPSVVFPESLCFEAVDSDNPFAVRGLYKGQWPGIVRPRFQWDSPVKDSSNG